MNAQTYWLSLLPTAASKLRMRSNKHCTAPKTPAVRHKRQACAASKACNAKLTGNMQIGGTVLRKHFDCVPTWTPASSKLQKKSPGTTVPHAEKAECKYFVAIRRNEHRWSYITSSCCKPPPPPIPRTSTQSVDQDSHDMSLDPQTRYHGKSCRAIYSAILTRMFTLW